MTRVEDFVRAGHDAQRAVDELGAGIRALDKLEEIGEPALRRLVRIAHRDHGQAVRVRCFLLGLYNGGTFKFDLTDLRGLDYDVQADVLRVLGMDMAGPRVEVHNRPGGEVIAEWAAEAWPRPRSRSSRRSAPEPGQ